MIRENQEALDRLILKLRPPEKPKAIPQGGGNFDDNRLIDKMLNFQNGDKMLRLLNGDYSDHSSQSEGDQALCNLLAFGTGNNEAQMDRIFRTSGLMREKWDTKHFGDGRTYGQATIEKAIAGTSETYRGATEGRQGGPTGGGWMFRRGCVNFLLMNLTGVSLNLGTFGET
ncbi:MAG: hypothetical protein ABIL06_09260 [Pseudomonadota bacterium]